MLFVEDVHVYCWEGIDLGTACSCLVSVANYIVDELIVCVDVVSVSPEAVARYVHAVKYAVVGFLPATRTTFIIHLYVSKAFAFPISPHIVNTGKFLDASSLKLVEVVEIMESYAASHHDHHPK